MQSAAQKAAFQKMLAARKGKSVTKAVTKPTKKTMAKPADMMALKKAVMGAK
jgi:hypothetical protein